MKNIFLISGMLFSFSILAQDNAKDIDTGKAEAKAAVKIFNTERAILSNTTETAGKGKMQFIVNHNFDDLAGSNGGIKNFFGLDNSTDIKIGFNIGLTEGLDVGFARAKGGHPRPELRMEKNYELNLKYRFLQQKENDPSHPLAVALFFSNVISAMDTAKTNYYKFSDFGDRMSQVIQLIVAKKMGKVSLQLAPSFISQGYLINHDLQRSMFALGGTVRFPILPKFNVIVDYMHPFRTKKSEEAFRSTQNFNIPIRFYDPLGIGFEVITAGHVFHLNFNNTTQFQETRFIPYNMKSWGDGDFRWSFTISRTFVLWRSKTFTENW